MRRRTRVLCADSRPGKRSRRLLAPGAAAVLAAAVTITSCDRSGGHSRLVLGSGTPLSQARTVPAFDAVDVAGTTAVSIRVGKPQSVTVRADDNLTGHIITRVQDGTLVITDLGSFRAVTPMTLAVTCASLERLTLSGDGSLDVHDIHAAYVAVRLSGTGLLQATGTTEQLSATLTGTGEEDLSLLTARAATALLTGTGHIALRATVSLTATVRGTGSIAYSGNPPRVVKSVTGTGSITAR